MKETFDLLFTNEKNKEITLRDYFAGLAMQGLLSNSTLNLTIPKESEQLANLVYTVADAMLKQREL